MKQRMGTQSWSPLATTIQEYAVSHVSACHARGCGIQPRHVAHSTHAPARWCSVIATGQRQVRNTWVLSAIVGLILWLTLVPGTQQRTSPFGCLLCGEEGLSDAIRNVILFAPFGFALARHGMKPFAALLLGAAFSIGVEGTQFFVPGRDAGLADVLTNMIGTAAGTLLFATRWSWLMPASRPAARRSLVASLVMLATVLMTGWLLQTSLPHNSYFGHWTPRFGHLEWYRGTVMEAEVGGIPTPSGEIDSSEAVRSLLLERTPVRVRALAGPPVPALGSLFSITDGERGILLIGPDRDDLVLQIRLRAAEVRLDYPDRRFRGVMATVDPGDTIQVVVWGNADGYCIALNDRETCDLGFSAGAGWTFIQNISALPPWAKEGMNGLWIMLLVIPFGFWARMSWQSTAGGILLVAGLLIAPSWVHLNATSIVEWAGALSGALGGALARQMIGR